MPKFDDWVNSLDPAGVLAGTELLFISQSDVPKQVSYTNLVAGFTIDEDTMASDSDSKVPVQQSVKAFGDNARNDQDIDGFLNQSETSLSFNDSTYEFTVTDLGSGWSYYRGGIKRTISGNKSVTLPGSPPTAGLYFIYIDADDGTLSQSSTAWSLTDSKIPVALLLWNNSLTPKYYIGEERHTARFPRWVHKYLHSTRGTQLQSGGTISGYTVHGSIDTENTFAIAETNIWDEDILDVCSALADGDGSTNNYTVAFRAGGGWSWEQSPVPFRYTTDGYIQWDNSGTMTEGQASKYYNTYLLATNFAGSARFIVIPGQGEFASLATAQARKFSDLTLTGLPVVEAVALYQFTWETSNSYSTKGKCRLATEPVKIVTSIAVASSTPGLGTMSTQNANDVAITGGNISGTSFGISKTQASHGFTVGEAIYYTGSAYAKAQADDADTLGVWIVSSVNGDDFTAAQIGEVTGLSGLTAGQYYFVSADTAGALTATEPSVYSNPILLATSTTVGIVLPLRPSETAVGGAIPGTSQLRLTTESGVPISTSDRTSQSTIYLTPYNGNSISLYTGSAWVYRSTAEVSLALSSLTSGKNYDVFAYWTGAAVALELSSAWTNDTTRADALTTQDGVYVKSGATTRLLVGTIRTTGTTTTEDSATKRIVSNSYNLVDRDLKKVSGDATWSITTGITSWRAANGDTSNSVGILVSSPGGALIDVSLIVQAYSTGTQTFYTSVGVDAVDGIPTSGLSSAIASAVFPSNPFRYQIHVSSGYHILYWSEKHYGSGTTVTVYGNSSGYYSSGMYGSIIG